MTARWRRYRPPLVLAAGVLLLLAAPAPGEPDRAADTAVASGRRSAAAPQAISLPTAATPAGGSAAGGSPATSTTGAAPATATAAGGAAGTPDGPGGAEYPGVGTPAALANPDCDPATGRIRFPSKHAPPCVVAWPSGTDNGGSTYEGVSKDTIRVVFYESSTGPPASEDSRAQWQRTFDTFNEHFELWGRRVKLTFYRGSGTDEVAQRADAIKVATELKPFLVGTASALAPVFSSEIAARRIVSWDSITGWRSTQDQQPYRWGNGMDDRLVVANVAEYVAKRLQGRPARWAGQLELARRTRAFGLVYPHTWDRAMIDTELSRNGVAVADALSFTQGDTVGAQERARIVISRLKDRGVTTVITGGDYLFNVVMTKEATSQLYSPEWVLTGWGLQDTALFARFNDQQQWAHAFGIGAVQLLLPPERFEQRTVYQWHHGAPPSSTTANDAAWPPAYQFMPCFHLAGPRLTPETFRDGCFAMPPSGGVHCGCVNHIGLSWGRHLGLPWLDYTGWDDMTEKWWSSTEQGTNEIGVIGPGVYMKVDGGKRYVLGQWPASDPRMFDAGGAVHTATAYSPQDRPPDYPHRPHD